ncbi:hypothetical protein SGLAD_v1c01110 [Spiroplasma gladiatoris]|uniref:Transmembrane protein n=1 Tax=Spiroplasma gladiatoris TaxID=2143 RepID=A0A4P7AGQ2_9MOLU|nr:hypothetical protein [Spiroplasma gladiatoris]QBQ07312.1 hypothetical protein SGLAD_v1c01110 [Spiroplasma gladiatoris]
MEFKLVKPILKKPLIWMGSIVFATLIIYLIVILTTSLEKKAKIIWVCQISLNFICIYFVSIVLNFSKASVTIFNDIHTTTNLETNEINVEIKASKYTHIFSIFFSIICFFIHITSGSQLQKITWGDYAKSYWWVFMIIMVYNIIYFYLFFNINSYLLNASEKFKLSYIDFYKNAKEHIDNKKSV